MDILIVVDRSGSMRDASRDHEGGINSFIDDQRANGSDAHMSLVQFDTHDPCEVVIDRVSLADHIDPFRLVPRGGTPLYDAIGQSVAWLDAKRGTDTGPVVMMIVTDGEENDSKEWTLARVKALIEEKEKAGWKFLFLAANIDAFLVGGATGFTSSKTASFNQTPHSVAAMYAVNASKLASSRGVLRSSKDATVAEAADIMEAGLSYTSQDRASIVSGHRPAAGTVAKGEQ